MIVARLIRVVGKSGITKAAVTGCLLIVCACATQPASVEPSKRTEPAVAVAAADKGQREIIRIPQEVIPTLNGRDFKSISVEVLETLEVPSEVGIITAYVGNSDEETEAHGFTSVVPDDMRVVMLFDNIVRLDQESIDPLMKRDLPDAMPADPMEAKAWIQWTLVKREFLGMTSEERITLFVRKFVLIHEIGHKERQLMIEDVWDEDLSNLKVLAHGDAPLLALSVLLIDGRKEILELIGMDPLVETTPDIPTTERIDWVRGSNLMELSRRELTEMGSRVYERFRREEKVKYQRALEIIVEHLTDLSAQYDESLRFLTHRYWVEQVFIGDNEPYTDAGRAIMSMPLKAFGGLAFKENVEEKFYDARWVIGMMASYLPESNGVMELMNKLSRFENHSSQSIAVVEIRDRNYGSRFAAEITEETSHGFGTDDT